VIGNNCSLFYDADYGNYLIEYRGNFLEEIADLDYVCGAVITDRIGIIAAKFEDLDQIRADVPSITYIDLRSMNVLQDISPSYVDNINNIKINPYLNLTGRGVVVGIIDTGIDYLNPEFIRPDDKSRILRIWDQSINDSSVSNETQTQNQNETQNENGSDTQTQTQTDLYIGKIFENDEINSAIEASSNGEDPYSIVPSRDTIGHGTRVAGIIGARGTQSTFRGVANECEFIIVKLFESTNLQQTIRANNIVPPPIYNTSEIVSAIEFLRQEFFRIDKPMIIFIGTGNTYGSHDGNSFMTRYITEVSDIRGICIVTGTGNEGNAQSHVSGNIPAVGISVTEELRISRNLTSFEFNIWLYIPNRASVNIISPTGESTGVISPSLNNVETYNFVFTGTRVMIRYFSPEFFTGNELINLRFDNIKTGIWKIQLTGVYILDGRYDMWLQPRVTLPEGVSFLNPNPYNTLTIPSTSANVVTVSALGNNNSIIATTSKGFNTNGIVNPNIATLGVDILTTDLRNGITTLSGSSAATAIITGSCALLFQWGIINGNDPTMYSQKIISYLIYGADRSLNYTFPNPDLGYGIFDLLGTFNILARIYNINTRSLLRDSENNNFSNSKGSDDIEK